MDQTSNTVTRLNKAAHSYHAIFVVHDAAVISTRDFMSQFADFANRWHGHQATVTYKWVRHRRALFYVLTGTRSVLKAFEAYLDHRGVAFHVEQYGHRHSEFERDVALLFHPVHGRHGRGSSR